MASHNGNSGSSCSIQPSDNGPLLVRGPVRLVDAEGNEFELRGRNIALCRCGGSANKPFCDRTHARIGFRSVVRAPAAVPEPAPASLPGGQPAG